MAQSKQWIYPLKIGIFHSFLYVYQRVTTNINKPMKKQGEILNFQRSRVSRQVQNRGSICSACRGTPYWGGEVGFIRFTRKNHHFPRWFFQWLNHHFPMVNELSGCWFQNFIFHFIYGMSSETHWLMFFKMVKTTSPMDIPSGKLT